MADPNFMTSDDYEDNKLSADGRGVVGGCCSRLKSEFVVSMFDTFDPATGKMIDVHLSFATSSPTLIIAVSKILLWGLMVQVLIWSWLDADYKLFFLAYLTHWALILATIYLTISTLVCMGIYKLAIIRIVWVLFPVTATILLLVVPLYWVLEYNPDVYDLDYKNFMRHGVGLLLVLIDGLILSHIPVRLKHVIFTIFFSILYVGWTLIHAYVIQDNPYKDDIFEDDDTIYEVIDWQKDPKTASIIAVVVCFGCAPIGHTLIWMLSLCGRKYHSANSPSSS